MVSQQNGDWGCRSHQIEGIEKVERDDGDRGLITFFVDGRIHAKNICKQREREREREWGSPSMGWGGGTIREPLVSSSSYVESYPYCKNTQKNC